MNDRELYRRILGLEAPWSVVDVELDAAGEEVRVLVAYTGRRALTCPKCDAKCSGYDHRQREWRHLDTCQFKTILVADIPRVSCPEHGVVSISVPWAEPGSRFTAMFETLVIAWLRDASMSAVARRMRISWDQVDGIMTRAVRRGLRRRESTQATRIGIDETSFKKRHKYVTVVADLDAPAPTVLHVGEGRGQETLSAFYETLTTEAKQQIEAVSMDMWQAYIQATRAAMPDADKKICFDKFHVAKHLGDAVDKVRRAEHRALMKDGDERLKGSKYLWLQNPDNMSEERWDEQFSVLRTSALKTARAWAVKEQAMTLWAYVRRGWALKAWKRLIGWMLRTRLEPVKRVGRMVKRHLWGIINAIVLKVTNAKMESINARIQRVKKMACGFRNMDRFKTAIYFHLGGLDLRPKALLAHSNS
jgi:transposase